MRRWAQMMAGSLATYAIVAACSGGSRSDNPTATVDAGVDSSVAAGGASDSAAAGGAVGAAGRAETAGGAGTSSAVDGSGGSLVDAGLDAIADAAGDVLEPVPDAAAAGASGAAGGPGAGGSAGTGTGGKPGTGGAAVVQVCDCPEPPEPYVPPEPEVVTVPCSVSVNIGSSTILHAAANFPGRTVQELAALRVVLNYSENLPDPAPAGYRNQIAAAVMLQDGRAVAQCGTENYYAAATATFILVTP